MIRPWVELSAIYLHREPVGMRKAINGLVAIVEARWIWIRSLPRRIALCNPNRTLGKMVVWDGNGFVLWIKLLEKARLKWPLSLSLDVVEPNAHQIKLSRYQHLLARQASAPRLSRYDG